MIISDIRAFPGLKVIELKFHGDDRGFFVERFNAALFEEAGLPTHFVQDNHSYSSPGVIRGMHYQWDRPQGKLISVITGAILDVVTDLRPNSPSFGKTFSIELTRDNGKCLWVPAGFAHGFCVLGNEKADVVYKVDALYNSKGESGIRWDDPDLAIEWPIQDPEVSDRDKGLASFKEYQQRPPQAFI